jgi:hypothetical protein
VTVATITDNTTGTYTGVEDCEIDVSTPTTNLGSASPMTSSSFNDEKPLIKFSGLSNIPSNATVTDVTVRLYAVGSPVAGSTIFSRVLRNWVENQATWNVFSTGNNWGTAGAAAGTDAAASSATINHGTSTGYVSYQAAGLISDVQNWVNGTNPNYGWLLTDSANYFEVVSSEGTDGQRPELIVTYSTATLEQEGYRWGVDDGSESAHTWEAAQDTSITLPDTQSRLVRLLVDSTGDADSTAYTLRYQKNGTGGYVPVPVGSVNSPTLSFGAAGTIAYSASGGTSVAPTYPSGITANSALVLVVGQKPSSANGGTVTTPSGWTLQAQNTGATDGNTGGYTTTLGADTGNTNIYVYTKDTVSGSESGTLSVTVGTNNVCWANIYRIQASDTGTLSYAGAVGKDTSAGNVSIATGSIDIAAGDYILAGMVIPTDVTTPSQFSAEALSQSGTTFGTVTEVQEPDSTTGNDIGGFIVEAAVSSGSGSGAVTLTATAGGTTTNVRGPGFVLRVRITGASNEVYVDTSSNITAGGEATTARLTAPSGKTTSDFVTGRRWDDENSETGDAIDITTDDYTEVEWLVALSSAPSDGDYFDFRVYAGSTALDTYTQTPRWTVGTAGPSTSFVYLRSIAPLLLH